jgi:hypothetical protein
VEEGTEINLIPSNCKSRYGNGQDHAIDQPLQSATKSIYAILHDNDNEDSPYREFMKLCEPDMDVCNEIGTADNWTVFSANYTYKNSLSYVAMDFNVGCLFPFQTNNYTVYVPTNDSIQELIDRKYLPTWGDVDDINEEDWPDKETYVKARNILINRINSFLRYHIQDNAVYVGAQPVRGELYETSKLNTETQRFYSLRVVADDNHMTVGYGPSEQAKLRNVRNVVTKPGLYNLMCREYWLSGSGTGRSINSSSDAVVHLIDGVLLYDDSLTSKTWEQELEELRHLNQ